MCHVTGLKSTNFLTCRRIHAEHHIPLQPRFLSKLDPALDVDETHTLSPARRDAKTRFIRESCKRNPWSLHHTSPQMLTPPNSKRTTCLLSHSSLLAKSLSNMYALLFVWPQRCKAVRESLIRSTTDSTLVCKVNEHFVVHLHVMASSSAAIDWRSVVAGHLGHWRGFFRWASGRMSNAIKNKN